MLTIEFEATGPLFDGRAEKAAAAYVAAVEEALADHGVRHVRGVLSVVLENPTGFYEAHIRNRQVDSGHLVTDSRVVYGPWLEGTGSRNDNTRFKGYASFRLATGQLDRSAEYYANRIIDPYLYEMGGRRT